MRERDRQTESEGEKNKILSMIGKFKFKKRKENTKIKYNQGGIREMNELVFRIIVSFHACIHRI